jgi:uncharacterized protein YvpB
MWMLKIIKYIFTSILILSLIITSGFLSLLLYFKATGSEYLAAIFPSSVQNVATTEGDKETDGLNDQREEVKERAESAHIDAPLVLQMPELYNGCEIATLTMMFNYYGIDKNKMELVHELKIDPTPIQYDKNGNIRYWGNPNNGFVGDITGKRKGYGIYHSALYELLAQYIPTGVDLTGEEFETLEQKVAEGKPVIVWTTVSYTVPAEGQWQVWDSPLGPIKATFQEHTVLLVGYDQEHVYINDPRKDKKAIKVDKERFINSWEAMGKQALTY